MKILIPVDGSEHANAALDFVATRSTLLGQEPDVSLINVQPELSARVTRAVGRDQARTYQRAQADDVLRPALDRLQRAGVAARAAYALGKRSDAIGLAAARGHVDVVVMGSHGHGAMKSLVLGSVAQRVAGRCDTPLLLIRDPGAARD